MKRFWDLYISIYNTIWPILIGVTTACFLFLIIFSTSASLIFASVGTILAHITGLVLQKFSEISKLYKFLSGSLLKNIIAVCIAFTSTAGSSAVFGEAVSTIVDYSAGLQSTKTAMAFQLTQQEQRQNYRPRIDLSVEKVY